jgi:hypothetical protein
MVAYVDIHNHDSMSSVDRIEQLQALARFPSRAKANELAVEVAAEHDLSPAALVDLMLAVQGDTRRATALNGALAASDLFLAGSIAKGVGKGAFYIAKNAAKNPYDWNRYSYKAAVQCGGEIRVRNAHLVESRNGRGGRPSCSSWKSPAGQAPLTLDAPSFPALAFRPDVGRSAIRGRERLTWFLDSEDFSTCTAWELKHSERLGMVLADSGGRCWKVLAVADLGVVKPFWERAFRFLMRQSVHRIDQRLIEIDPLALDQVKERACASIEANPDDWRDDEAIAGEDGAPREEREMLDELQEAVRTARTLPQLINALYREDLPG